MEIKPTEKSATMDATTMTLISLTSWALPLEPS
jgi:hypothetical protein